jgi:hypothetical protein
MDAVEYIEPSGDDIADPTPEQVVGYMRQAYDDYWGPYSPMGCLKRGNPPSSQLVFIRHPRRGWYLEYETDGPPKRRVVAVDPAGQQGAWVEHWHEGQTSFFPPACFLPLAVAEQAVTDFLAAHDPSASGSWEPFRWDTHKRASPPDDESAVIERADPAE